MKDQWMCNLDIHDFHSLEQFRGNLLAYVQTYNQSPHSSPKGMPSQDRHFSEPNLFHYNLEGMSKNEVRYYISEKLKDAGCNQTIFEYASTEAILNVTDGAPRLINNFCNSSMLIGDSGKAELITTNIVMQAVSSFELG